MCWKEEPGGRLLVVDLEADKVTVCWLGVCISAAILTLVIVLGLSSGSSLLAHSEQEKVSPTYAEPNAGGRDRLGERMKSSSFELDDD